MGTRTCALNLYIVYMRWCVGTKNPLKMRSCSTDICIWQGKQQGKRSTDKMVYLACLMLASYADALWTRHPIFHPHKTSAEPKRTFLNLCLLASWLRLQTLPQISGGEHVKIALEPISISLLCNEALVGGLFMSPIWISNLSTSQFRKVNMSLSEFRPMPLITILEMFNYRMFNVNAFS